ncbi:transcription termination factor MTERF2, chloroplastic-like [Zingiber officinale]|uniref:transcription termination factor MTERF2, chloroplastic-like n=1 Tax=Zingiber officinale TaxID=94328 RepID=UPI001C4AF861|nr:transcription termination factor MTERF2, chloroplastic-like [Zingiber officinale]
MFRRLCAGVHRQLQVTVTLCHRWTAAASSPHFLGFVKPYSVSSVSADDLSSPTASFLSRSCGISDHAAFSISKKVPIDALDKALRVLALLKNYGFNEAHLVRLVDRYPRVLLMDVKKTLKPKLELFRGIGLVGTALPEILSARPVLLRYSVEKRLVPNAELLKSISITNANLVDALKHSPWLITFGTGTTLLPKVDALRAYGVPNEVILLLLTRYGHALVTDTDRFNETFDLIKKMGISPKRTTFARALGVLAILPKKKWEEIVENLRGLGWSQDLVSEAFAKQPHMARVSTEKTRKIVKFLEEKLAWTPEDTVKYPAVLLMSLEKRLMPRYAVLHILMQRGLIKPGVSGNHFLVSNEKFRMQFVTKYQEKAPEIVEAIKGVESSR